jgi:hypothetical protein
MRSSTPQPGRWARRWLLALAGSLGLATAAQAQAPANDDPCGAVTLTPQGALCTAPVTSTNLNATTTVPNGYGNTGSPRDVWFKFTTAATGPASFGATITVNGNPATFVQLFSAASCAGPFTPITYSASNQANTTAPRLITGVLAASTTYYVRVSGNSSFNDQPGAFTICVSDGPGTATCGTPSAGPFVSTGPGTGTVAFTPGVNNLAPYALTVRDLTAQSTLGSFTPTTSPLSLTGLLAGHSYSVEVVATCAGTGQASGTGSYTFTLPVANDNPCGALPLPLTATCVPTTGDNSNATLSTVTTNGPGNCAQGAPGSHDVWYTITTTANGVGSTGFTVQTSGNGGSVGTLRVYRAASCAGPFTQLGCATSTAVSGGGIGPPPLVVSGLAPSTTYYLRVDEGGFFSRAQPGYFAICAIGAAGCAAPSQPYAGLTTTSTAPVYFTPGNGNQSYTISYTALGGTTQTATTTGSPYALTGLLPGTQYAASIVGNCAGGQTSTPATFNFTTAIANDEPCGAVPLTFNATASCQSTTYGSVNGATATVPYGYTNPSCGAIFSNPDDVWFSFTTPASGPGSTSIDLALTGTEKQLSLFSAASCAGPFTLLGCAGVSTGQLTPPTLTVRSLTPGTLYFVRVATTGSTNPAAATFTLCLNAAPDCAPPTALSVTAPSATSASLAFTAGFGAGSYTVTYQAAGGSLQTVTPAPTASPVLLPNLVTGQTYTATISSSCGTSQVSTAASITFVAGGCAARAYAPFPFAETFEAQWLDVCGVRDAPNAYWRTTPVTGSNSWRRDDDGAAANWTGTNIGGYTPAGSRGSAHAARFHSTYAVNQAPGQLDLFLNLSADPGSKRLTFDYLNTTGNDSLLVLLSNDGGSTFVRLRGVSQASSYATQTIDFPSASATAVLRFVGKAATSGNTNNTDINLDNVQVQLAPPCASPVLTTGPLTPTTATFNILSGTGGSTYVITYQAANGPVQTVTPAPGGSSLTLSSLTPGTTYTLTAATNCGGGVSTPAFSLSFTTPVAGDDCATALPYGTLGVGGCTTPLLVNNTQATTSTPATSCSTILNDLWYTVTVPASGVVEATTSTAGNSRDTVLELYSGTCGNLTSLGCNDDINTTTNAFSNVRAAGLTPGATVYVRVGSYSNGTPGTFNLCVQTDAPCPAVTNLAVNLTATPPSVSFAGPPNASGYTLTLTSAGQPTVTVTGSASPLILPTLQPFTSYTVSVVGACGGGLTSAPATLTFATTEYCTTNLGGSCPGNILTNVSIVGTALNNTTTCATLAGGNVYASYPAVGSTTARLEVGTTYQYRITSDGQSDIMAWIDFNRDGIFSANEGTQVILNSGAGLPATASFLVPTVSPLGNTGMRVRSRTAGSGNGPGDACTQFGSGEVEDYVVEIVLPTAARESALAAQVKLYPNPATTAVTLALPAALSQRPVVASLYNGLGQLVRQQALPARSSGLEAQLDLGGLARGVYSLQLPTAAGLVVKRLVVE